LYDPKSRGAESYVQLSREIVSKHMPGFVAFPEVEKKEEVVAQLVAAGAENQATTVPRWRRWRDRNKLVTMDLK